MEASFEGGQGPEGAVAPYREWNGKYRLTPSHPHVGPNFTTFEPTG